MDWQKELFKEKKLSEVYRSAWKFSESSGDRWILASVALFLIVILGLWWFYHDSLDPSEAVINTTRMWAEAGVTFSTSILGFLLAGFAIFSSVTKPDLFIALANIPYKDSNLSRLKYVFFNFLVVFIHYLGFLALCLGIHLFLSEDMPLTKLLGQLTVNCDTLRFVISSVVLVVVGTWFVTILLLLKSFIWNLYQSVLLAIATEEEIRKRDRGDNS